MLIRSHDDASTDEERWAFVTSQGFGHFVASGAGRSLPVVVPTQFLLDGDHVLFHLSVRNPVFAYLQENWHALMSVAGDWAYIPGAWKAIADEDPRRGIPTTYYAAVQLLGEVSVIADADGVAEVLRRQLGGLEPRGEHVDPSEHGPKLRGIHGVDLLITEVRAKFKFGGNVDRAHRDHVASMLRERQGQETELRSATWAIAGPSASSSGTGLRATSGASLAVL